MKCKEAALILALGVVSFSLPSPAQASCPCHQNAPAEHVKNSSSIFAGMVVSADDAPGEIIEGFKGRALERVRVQVTKRWKGRSGSEAPFLFLTDGECPLTFKMLVGKRVVVVLGRKGTREYAHYCDLNPIHHQWDAKAKRAYERLLPGVTKAEAGAMKDLTSR